MPGDEIRPLLLFPGRTWNGKNLEHPTPGVYVGDGGSRQISQTDWAWLAVRHPALLQVYIDNYNDADGLSHVFGLMRRVLETDAAEISRPELLPDPSTLKGDGYFDLTDLNADDLRRFIGAHQSAAAILHFNYDNQRKTHQVLWQKLLADSAERVAAAWTHGALSAMSAETVAALRKIVTGHEMTNMMCEEARVLLIPGGAGLVAPRPIVMQLAHEDARTVAEFILPTARPPLASSEIMLPERTETTLGDRLRKEGRDLAGEFDRLAKVVWNDTNSRSLFPDRSRIEELGRLCGTIADLHPDHPTSRAFYGKLNDIISRNGAAAESVFQEVDFLERTFSQIGYVSNDKYAVIRGPRGVERIVRADDGKLADGVAPLKSMTELSYGPLFVSQGNYIVNIYGAVMVLNGGLDFMRASPEEILNAQIFGGLNRSFPAMDYAASAILTSVATYIGKSAGDVTVLDYGPGYSLAAMTAFARSGANVSWKEMDAARRIQTEHAMTGLPGEIRERISAARHNDRVSADVVIRNGPGHRMKIGDMGRALVKRGMLVVQTPRTAESYLAQGSGRMRLLTEVPLGPGGYVFPPSVTSHATMGMPHYFQVWQAVR